MAANEPSAYFSEHSTSATRHTYLVLGCFVLVLAGLSVLAPLLAPACDNVAVQVKHPNPDYDATDGCRHVRYWLLLGMSKWEADMNVRIIMSLACSSLIGFELRRADRAAGIRTMALVCLGACVFTIASTYAFVDGPMAWDASRVAAAIPSGVGFLGAASIWKGTRKSADSDEEAPEVHGLTTATSVWLSSAVGILAGGRIYVIAIFVTATAVVYLRFAPRLARRDGLVSPRSGQAFADFGRSVAAGVGFPAGSALDALREPLVAPGAGGSGQPSGVPRTATGESTVSEQPRRSTSSCRSDATLHM